MKRSIFMAVEDSKLHSLWILPIDEFLINSNCSLITREERCSRISSCQVVSVPRPWMVCIISALQHIILTVWIPNMLIQNQEWSLKLLTFEITQRQWHPIPWIKERLNENTMQTKDYLPLDHPTCKSSIFRLWALFSCSTVSRPFSSYKS